MKRNVLNFFKSSACVKSFFVFGAAFLAFFSISCKQLASFDPVVNGEQVVVGGGNGGDSSSLEAAEFSFNLKATHGFKQKISLEWTAFSGAKYYEIYFAESAASEFTKIGETEQPFFDDAVAAGRTGYFKVCAVKSNGTSTPFSSTVVGTSLAVPIISGGDVNDSSAAISWFMENARGIDGTDYYEKSLKFEVFCGLESKILSAADFPGGSYKCTFENLAGSTDYEFYVRAYLSTDQQSYEDSAKVNKETLTSYMPLAPKFNASEGESAKGVLLYITLPEMVMVNTVTKDSSDNAVDVKYPLYFKIYRKVAEGGGNYDKVCDLYYNGSITPPMAADYKDSKNGYNAEKTIEWFDESADLQGGVKYEYMIRSFVDCGYSKVVCPEGKEYKEDIGTAPDKATKGIIGWKSAHPSFKLKMDEIRKTLSTDGTKVLSYEFGFSAEWNDLGKADKYKFAIKQTRTLDAGSSGNGTDTWLEKGGSIFFDTLDKINSHLVKFGSASGLRDDEKGVYTYTLYIVPKSETGIDESKVLDSVAALDTIQVTPDVNLPEANLTVQGGYKDKVVLKISSLGENDADVTYKIARTKWKGENQEGYDEFELNIPSDKISEGTYEYNDENLAGDRRYSYVLTATSASGAWAKSQSQEAETLGTPKVSFSLEALAYDSVTISFNGVLAAEKYIVTLGASDGFGGGEEFEITKDSGDKWKSNSARAEVEFLANKFTVKIKQPYGYDNASLAGKTANLTVTAHSGVDNASDGAKVNVLGPATLDAKVNAFAEAKEDSISLTWKAVDGAKGYLIRRVMYDDAAMTKVAENSEVTYYCDASGNGIMANGEKVYDKRAEIKLDSNRKFTLTDTYKENDLPKDNNEPDRDTYQRAQAKIFWGLPFRYVVLPVLSEKDFDFNGLKPEGGNFTYNNLKPTDGTATLGYGMEVHAEKSKNTKKQTITWVKPFYASQVEPRVFRRLTVAGEAQGNFSLVGASTELTTGANKFEYELENNDKYNAYEYIVQYGVVSIPVLNSDLLKDFESRKDSESPTEQANKGYLFTVEDFNLKTSKLAAVQGGSNTYAETVKWDTNMKPWEYKNRALGPTGVKLYIMNNNIDGDWHPVATIGSMDYSGNVAPLGDDVSAEKGSNGISLYPTSIANGSSGTTSGMFKVLRDYKHYYALSLTRGNLETQKYTGDDNFEKDSDGNEIPKVFAYRQETPQEFARIANLVLAEGLNRVNGTGWNTGNFGREKKTDFGTVKAKSNFGVTDWDITYTNYEPPFQTKTDETVKIAKANGTFNPKTGAVNQYPQSYEGGPVTITLSGGTKKTGTIKFNTLKSGSGTMTVTFDGKTESFSADNYFNTPLPFSGGGYKYNDEQWQ